MITFDFNLKFQTMYLQFKAKKQWLIMFGSSLLIGVWVFHYSYPSSLGRFLFWRWRVIVVDINGARRNMIVLWSGRRVTNWKRCCCEIATWFFFVQRRRHQPKGWNEVWMVQQRRNFPLLFQLNLTEHATDLAHCCRRCRRWRFCCCYIRWRTSFTVQ